MSPSPSAPEPNTIAPGSVIAGKYVVEKTIGEGGMGIVVAAKHKQLDQNVAIKCLLPKYIDEKEVVARFLREGQAAIKIRSEHVVRIFDVGELPTGAPYMVMEYLEGKDLDDLIHENGPLAVPQAVDYLLQALEAIAEAHALGMVHRDLKPANLFLSHRVDGSPCIKVLDFGISKVSRPGEGTDMGLTSAAAVMGSPHYMAPEQMRSARDVDARADVWALGAILHEMLAGGPPFRGATYPELFSQILQDRPPPFSNFRADVPPALDQAVLLCMEKEPEKRFRNVAELAFAIAPFGSPIAQASAERIGRVLQVAPQNRLSQDFGNAATMGVPTANSFPPQSALAQSLAVAPGAVAAGSIPPGRSFAPPTGGSFAPTTGGAFAPTTSPGMGPPQQRPSYASVPAAPPSERTRQHRTMVLMGVTAGAIVIGAIAFAVIILNRTSPSSAATASSGTAVNSSGSAIASGSPSSASSAPGAPSTFAESPSTSASGPIVATPAPQNGANASSTSSTSNVGATSGATPVTATVATSSVANARPRATTPSALPPPTSRTGSTASPPSSAVAQRTTPTSTSAVQSPNSRGSNQGINGNNVVNGVERDLRDGVNRIFH